MHLKITTLLLVCATAAQANVFWTHPQTRFQPISVSPWSHPQQTIVAPISTSSQFHAQDELGQASFGYSHPGQSSVTHRDAFGNQVGSYQYVNPEGKLIRVDYIADSRGFRVASNALPVAPGIPAAVLPVGPLPVEDTSEVKQARAEHFAAIAEAKARSKRSLLTTPFAILPTAASVHALPAPTPLFRSFAPVHATVPAAPVHVLQTFAAPTPVVPDVSAQRYHAQTELGEVAFGHSQADQAHSATRDAWGNVVGSYRYINPEGQEIVTHYTAGRGGVRVWSNALPEGPSAVAVGPSVVQDTPEVAQAKMEHRIAFLEAKNRTKQ